MGLKRIWNKWKVYVGRKLDGVGGNIEKIKGICWKDSRWGWREYRIKEMVWGGVGEQLNGMGK